MSSSQQATYFFQLSREENPKAVKSFKITFPFVPHQFIQQYAKGLGLEIETHQITNYYIAIFDSSDNQIGILDESSQSDLLNDDNKYRFVFTAKQTVQRGVDNAIRNFHSLFNGIPILKLVNENGTLFEERVAKIERETMELSFYPSSNFLLLGCAVKRISLLDITNAYIFNPNSFLPKEHHLWDWPGIELRMGDKMTILLFKSIEMFDLFLEIMCNLIRKGELIGEDYFKGDIGNCEYYYEQFGEITKEYCGDFNEDITNILMTQFREKIVQDRWGVEPDNFEKAADILYELNTRATIITKEVENDCASFVHNQDGLENNPNIILDVDGKPIQQNGTDGAISNDLDKLFSKAVGLIATCAERLIPECAEHLLVLSILHENKQHTSILLLLLPTYSKELFFKVTYAIGSLSFANKNILLQQAVQAIFKSAFSADEIEICTETLLQFPHLFELD